MKVLLCTRIVPENQPYHPMRHKDYDVVDIILVDEPLGKRMVDNFIMVPMDLSIPCGKLFKKGNNCSVCKYNVITECDVIKFTMPLLTSGTLFEAPKLSEKSKWRVDWSQFISKDSIEAIKKIDKTDVEKAQIEVDAKSHEQSVELLEAKDG